MFGIPNIVTLITLIGAGWIWFDWQRWWNKHPRLSAGKLKMVPAVVTGILWVAAMTGIYLVGTHGAILVWVVLLTFAGVAIYHLVSLGWRAEQAIEHTFHHDQQPPKK